MPPPMAKPMPARQPLMARWVQISPLASRLQPALSTALGAGRIRVDSQPATTAICQIASKAIGKAQGARRTAKCSIVVLMFNLVTPLGRMG